MKYFNPIIMQDYLDPDVIRVGNDFFMVASSFNQLPGLPILHSNNLVNWRIVNYIYDKLPSPYYDTVRHGDGAWAPSIRYHNGTYYCLIPMPEKGIYESHTKNIYGKWSRLKLVIRKKGLEDPCPIWIGDKAYVVVGFAKSRAGFNSCLGLYEMETDLSKNIGDYKIIYDGHNMSPTIEGPKFNERNGYYYIMAPAGSVKSGWQVCLRSKNIYGPYESKIVLYQGDTLVNGPHQGALIDLGDDKWAFIHFQDMRAYGRICHLQPVTWFNDWPICGKANDFLLPGTPVSDYNYLVDVASDFNLDLSNDFSLGMNLNWQTPANKKDGWMENTQDGVKLYCVNGIKPLNLQENHYLEKVGHLFFDIKCEVYLNLLNENDEVGFSMMGREYSYVCVVRRNNQNYLEIRHGAFGEEDKTILMKEYNEEKIVFNLNAVNKNIYDLLYRIGYNDKIITDYMKASAGRWIGSKVGIYARGNDSKGYGLFKYFNVIKK